MKIIAIGAGPGGIATAIEAIEMGMKSEDILILEKGEVPIDAIRKFYPDKKMTIANYKGLPTSTEGHLPIFPDLTKAQTLIYFDDLIKKYNLQVKYKSEVHKVQKVGDGFEVFFNKEKVLGKTVAIGIGILGRPNKPSYKLPSSLRNHLLYDMTSQKISEHKVLVVGGGDTSSEYCQILVQENNDVTLVYRGAQFNRMMDQNAKAVDELSKSQKMKVFLNSDIKEIEDRDGKPFVISADETKFSSGAYDKVIFSIGGSTPLNFLMTTGIECENNWPKYGSSGETNLPGAYLVGDLAVGKTGGSIITAYNSAFRTVKHIQEYLK
ncbi:MAG: NAD(P)-binding domain-containing protein [Deltaproteobacteria bacterium]|nr:NAD(P)-binding domain-containing protein [Deltaproteobacteria bacterium]